MIVLGLTGSIGMGKTTIAGMFRRQGVPVHDADRVVHRLLGLGGAAVAAVAAAFGADLVQQGAIDRRALGARVFRNQALLRQLESILHPLVRLAERRFLSNASQARSRLVVLDIPLLFETGGEGRVDATVVVTAPAFVQRGRVMARPGMTADKLDHILSHQMPDRLKRQRADFIVKTGLGKRHAALAVARIIRETGAWTKRRGIGALPLSRQERFHARNRY